MLLHVMKSIIERIIIMYHLQLTTSNCLCSILKAAKFFLPLARLPVKFPPPPTPKEQEQLYTPAN